MLERISNRTQVDQRPSPFLNEAFWGQSFRWSALAKDVAKAMATEAQIKATVFTESPSEFVCPITLLDYGISFASYLYIRSTDRVSHLIDSNRWSNKTYRSLSIQIEQICHKFSKNYANAIEAENLPTLGSFFRFAQLDCSPTRGVQKNGRRRTSV